MCEVSAASVTAVGKRLEEVRKETNYERRGLADERKD